MTKIRLHLLVLLITLLILGCVKKQSIRYETIVRSPKPQDYAMEIFDPVDIDEPYKVIGIVQVDAGKNYSIDKAIEHLKDEARKMGGDALIDLQQGPSTGGVLVPVGDIYVYGNGRQIWNAKVIVWE